MSAWIAGSEVAQGNIIALLDSDDLWETNYLEKIVEIYSADHSIDFVYCNMQKFGTTNGLMLTGRRHMKSRDLGLSILMGAYKQRWQGVATSGNTLKRDLLAKILQLPRDQALEWKTRPDDCLFYGSDILGGHKYYLAQPLALHREHSSNAMLQYKSSPMKQAYYAIRLERMLDHYRKQMGLSSNWLKLAKYEFRTKPKPILSEFFIYSGLALRAPISISQRANQVFSILKHYLRSMIPTQKGAA